MQGRVGTFLQFLLQLLVGASQRGLGRQRFVLDDVQRLGLKFGKGCVRDRGWHGLILRSINGRFS